MPFGLGFFAVAGAGAGGAGAFDLLETALPNNAASVTFSNLNTYSAYKHLQIRFTARNSSTGTTTSNIDLTFNSSATGYARHILNGDGTTVTSQNATSNSTIQLLDCSVSNSATANVFGGGIVDILDFGSTNKNKTIRIFTGAVHSGENDVNFASGLWADTAAISSITLAPINAFNFVNGTRISLYGIKG